METNIATRAADAAGGQSALARAIGCSPQAVQRMCATGRIPAERVLQIESVTGISRHELRPDLYPNDAGAAVGSVKAGKEKQPKPEGLVERRRPAAQAHAGIRTGRRATDATTREQIIAIGRAAKGEFPE